MKIALFNCNSRSVPPKKSGGIEKNIDFLIQGFLKRGHQVTLFSTGDSLKREGMDLVYKYKKEIEAMNITDIRKDELNHKRTWELGKLLVKKQYEFDIICNFCLSSALMVLPNIKIPFVSRIAEELTPEAVGRLMPYKDLPYISLSDNQRVPFPQLNYVATIYNCTDIKEFPRVRKSEDFYLFVGRISGQKQPHLAIKAAARMKKKIILIGKYKDTHIEGEYYEKVFLPTLKKHAKYATWIGEQDQKTVYNYFSRAIVSLHPVSFSEPFGNAVIESMASGCPVIVFNKGAYKETVVEGKTGFVVNNLKEMVEKLKVIEEIDRKECKRYVKESFNVDKMVENYLAVFENLLKPKKFDNLDLAAALPLLNT
jgi:glycosyltransferase involved in cell wall biosynthesis